MNKRRLSKKKILPYPKKLRKITRFSRDSLRNLIKTEQPSDNNNSPEKTDNGYALEDLEYAQNSQDGDDFEEDEYCYVYDECSFRSSFYYIITVLMLIAISMNNEMFIKIIYLFIRFEFAHKVNVIILEPILILHFILVLS